MIEKRSRCHFWSWIFFFLFRQWRKNFAAMKTLNVTWNWISCKCCFEEKKKKAKKCFVKTKARLISWLSCSINSIFFLLFLTKSSIFGFLFLYFLQNKNNNLKLDSQMKKKINYKRRSNAMSKISNKMHL